MIRCILDEQEGGNFRWMDIAQPQPDELEQVAADFGLSHYAVKDCLEPDHLPKFENTDGYQFAIVRFYSPKTDEHKSLSVAHLSAKNGHTAGYEMSTVQNLTSKIAFFYNDNFLITIHRRPVSFMDDIREKYVDGGFVKTPSAAVVKTIWYVLHSYEKEAEALVAQIDRLERRIFLRERIPDLQQRLYLLKRKASLCQRILFVTRDVMARITTTPDDAASLQDVRDLHNKLEIAYDQMLEDVTNLLNVYISLSAQRTNDVVKILTIFSVFFMPLTFIAGIYGMNFKHMPELEHKWGYPATLLFMAAVSLGIYIWFRRKRWL
ncbi:MAG: hypothetical protein MUD08_06765 [Cytophagales bacterium]|jgi:magnesium transporter|nr:hypothetical protein [Cytophagales bacterium]